MDPLFLRLSLLDDEIYEHFRSQFSDMNIKNIDEADLKSTGAKEVQNIAFALF